MKKITVLIALVGSMTISPTAVLAQLHAAGPVTNGHHHLNVSDTDAHMRFWVDTLGGKAGTFAGRAPIAMFPNALVFLREQDPTGGSIGSTVDHVGFSVPDLRAVVDRLVAAGYEMITEESSPPNAELVDGVRILGNGPVSAIAFVLGPDEVKVEVLERRGQEEPIVSDHIHFFGDEQQQMREWYADVFGAAVRSGQNPAFISADLPGLALNFSATEAARAGTAGRVIDHIGFEIENLEAFVAGLEANGIELDMPYREIPDLGLALAFLTDPWGTYIELTEGLDSIR